MLSVTTVYHTAKLICHTGSVKENRGSERILPRSLLRDTEDIPVPAAEDSRFTWLPRCAGLRPASVVSGCNPLGRASVPITSAPRKLGQGVLLEHATLRPRTRIASFRGQELV